MKHAFVFVGTNLGEDKFNDEKRKPVIEEGVRLVKSVEGAMIMKVHPGVAAMISVVIDETKLDLLRATMEQLKEGAAVEIDEQGGRNFVACTEGEAI